MSRSVLCIDPPAFCTTVEALVAPALRGRPLAVAPPGADRATVLALSAEAQAAGITRGMPVRQARKRCPDLVLLPPNPVLYARASRALHEILRRYAPVIEPRGYGHAFLDVTGTGALFGPAVDVAARIHREARTGIRLPVAVGVGTNKLVTEVAAGQRDRWADGRMGRLADGQSDDSAVVPVPAGEEAAFLAPRPVTALPDVPARIRERLDDYQLELIGAVAAVGAPALGGVFGPAGFELHSRACGIDPRPVLPPALKREFRAAHTFASDTNDLGVLYLLLRRLAERIGARLRERRFVTRRLRVDLAYADYSTAARTVPHAGSPLDLALVDAARRVFTLANTKRIAIRTVVLTADRLAEEEMQLELWMDGWADGQMGGRTDRRTDGQMNRRIGGSGHREVALQAALDRIRTRWGTRGVVQGI
jgi:DNA polymerase-4